MVYIDRNGRVLEKRPWDVERVIGIITGIWFIVLQFFTTLIAPFKQEKSDGGNDRRGGSWGSGGGGGGGGRGSGDGGLRPNRRIGRIKNSVHCNIPGGGCSR